MVRNEAVLYLDMSALHTETTPSSRVNQRTSGWGSNWEIQGNSWMAQQSHFFLSISLTVVRSPGNCEPIKLFKTVFPKKTVPLFFMMPAQTCHVLQDRGFNNIMSHYQTKDNTSLDQTDDWIVDKSLMFKPKKWSDLKLMSQRIAWYFGPCRAAGRNESFSAIGRAPWVSSSQFPGLNLAPSESSNTTNLPCAHISQDRIFLTQRRT